MHERVIVVIFLQYNHFPGLAPGAVTCTTMTGAARKRPDPRIIWD